MGGPLGFNGCSETRRTISPAAVAGCNSYYCANNPNHGLQPPPIHSRTSKVCEIGRQPRRIQGGEASRRASLKGVNLHYYPPAVARGP